MAYILHIDTSSNLGSVVLSKNGALLHCHILDDAKQQAAIINRVVEQICNEEGISLQQLDAIAVVSGPGSYTGLRIGLATAKAFCYALDIPLMMQDKLTLLSGAMAELSNVEFEGYGAVLIAREGEYFMTILGEQPPCHLTAENLQTLLAEVDKKICITGQTENLLPEKNISYHSGTDINHNYWAISANQAFLSNEFASIASAEPLYLKQVFIHKSNK